MTAVGRRCPRRWLLLALLAAGCAPVAPTPTPPPTPPPPTSAPPPPATAAAVLTPTARPVPSPLPAGRSGGRAVEGVLTLPGSLNPLLADDPPARRLAALLYQGLTSVSPDTLEPVPALAASWLYTDEARVYTFQLRPNLTWHDGQPVTATDVATTLRAVAADRGLSVRAATLAGLLEVALPLDPLTVRVALKQSYAPFLTELATLPILPAAQITGLTSGLERSPAGGQPIGSGPFSLARREADRLILRRFPGYWAGPVPLDELELRRVADPAALIDGLQRGELDLAELAWSWLTQEHHARLSTRASLMAVRYPSLALELLVFGLSAARQPALSDARVRRALAQAIDRPNLAAQATLGIGGSPSGTLPPHSWAAVPGIEPNYPLDPVRAGALLDAAGWPLGADGRRQREGQPLALTIDVNSGNRARTALAQGVAAAWRALGVGVTTREEPFDAFVERIVQRADFDVCLLGIDLGPDPDQSLLWESRSGRGGYNLNRYSNAQVDRLLASGRATLDRERRTRLYDDLQRLVLTDLPVLPLLAPPGLLALGPRLQNVVPNAAEASHGAARWWVSGA